MAEDRMRRATQDRHSQLLAMLRDGTTSVEDLAAAVRVSPSTVRRDLARLTREGRVARTYGGALVPDVFHERAVGESARFRPEAKSAIASVAAGLVPDGGSVFLDAGTTCGALAQRLRESAHLTVVTRGLEAAVTLAVDGGPEVLVLGGRVRPMSHGLIGPLTDLALDRLGVDVAFIGADAVHPRRGVGEPTVEEIAVKERVAQRARQVVVLADATKLVEQSLPAWAAMPSGWCLLTDSDADELRLEEFRDAGVTVLVADGGP